MRQTVGAAGFTYTVQMERMWSTDCTAGRDDQLDDGVLGQADDAAFGHEVLCLLRAAQDLEQHGYAGRREGRVVDEKVGSVLSAAGGVRRLG